MVFLLSGFESHIRHVSSECGDGIPQNKRSEYNNITNENAQTLNVHHT